MAEIEHNKIDPNLLEYKVYLIKDEEFYIIPHKAVKGKNNVTIIKPKSEEERVYKRHKPYVSTSQWNKYKNAWHLLEK